jgi:hydroxymethylpyrimidine/phosphomethylpyrimidine kinase
MKLVVALAACLLGYGEVGLWLKEEARAPDSWVQWEGNPYLKWMEDYSGDVYQKAVKAGLGEDVTNVLGAHDSM